VLALYAVRAARTGGDGCLVAHRGIASAALRRWHGAHRHPRITRSRLAPFCGGESEK